MAFEQWTYYDRALTKAAGSTLTEFPLVIDGSLLSDNFWDNVRSDLGDVRASLDSGWQLPCYVHSYDYANRKAIIFVKATVGVGQVPIRIWYHNPTATTPPVTDTYGRNACFNSNIRAYYPDGSGLDVTQYANHLTPVGTPTYNQAGPIPSAKSTEYDGATEYAYATNNVPSGYPLAMLGMARPDLDTVLNTYMCVTNLASAGDYHIASFNGAQASNPLQATSRAAVGSNHSAVSSSGFAQNVWAHASAMFDSAASRRIGINGAGYGSNAGSATPSGLNRIGVGAAMTSAGIATLFDGKLSFVQLHTAQLSNDWAAYDSSMLSDQATFWGEWQPRELLDVSLTLPDTKTITVTQVHDAMVGGCVTGTGFGQPVFPWHTRPGAMSSVIWAGGRDNGEIMWQYNAQQAVYEKFNLWGASRFQLQPDPPETPKPAKVPVGLLIEKVPTALDNGTGHLVLRDMCIAWAGIGIKGATDFYMSNCECITTERVFFDSCDIGCQINNAQGLGWRHVSPVISGCTTFLDYVTGGDLHVDNATVISPAPFTFLKLHNTPSGFGGNGAKFTIREVKLDNISVNAVMLDMEEGVGGLYYTDVSFEDLHFPWATWTEPAFKVAGHTTLYIDRAKNLMPGIIKVLNSGDAFSPRIVITNSTFNGTFTSATDLIHSSSTGDCHLVVTGLANIHNPHDTLPDYNGMVG
jgi:hypothetical protein